jgi:aminopeptidase N
MARLDPHSYCDDQQPQAHHVNWHATVDFDARVLQCSAILLLRQPAPAETVIDLDTRGLQILDVESETAGRLRWHLYDEDPILGARLEIALPAGLDRFEVRYRTSPSASALQWLEPAMTAGGQHPYLFSQCQAIHARAVLPCQDTPRVRLTYEAWLTVPSELRAVMAAGFVSRREDRDVAVEHFRMTHAIPPYLFAFAVGDLTSRELGTRSRVWAEPDVVGQAAWEFIGVDELLQTAEKLFGPYDWDRFDLLTMPPSFPYGGMENPCLTFLTPTLLAGDRSMVNVVAHELAHSWTGNLISNASAEHFWLNEGFTMYAERRLIEVVEGEDMALLHAALGRRELDRAMASFADRPQLRRLRTQLAGIDPDEVYSLVPYEKGFLFLRTLENAVRRERFDPFVKAYIERFRFQSITTDDFLNFLRAELPEAFERVDVEAWVDGEDIPANAWQAHSYRLESIQSLGSRLPSSSQTQGWSPVEWELYLENLPEPADRKLCERLESSFNLSEVRNYDVLVKWLTVATTAGFDAVLGHVERVLGAVGRMKYLKPLYGALYARTETRENALRCFERYRARYHPIATAVIGGLLAPGEVRAD